MSVSHAAHFANCSNMVGAPTRRFAFFGAGRFATTGPKNQCRRGFKFLPLHQLTGRIG
jgi:hypothetical protein